MYKYHDFVLLTEPPKLQPFSFPKASAGKKITASCSAFEGSQPIIYKLYHNGKELSSSEDVFVQYIPSLSMLSISIQNAMPQHNGNYTCVAKNEYGVDSFSTILNIQGKF